MRNFLAAAVAAGGVNRSISNHPTPAAQACRAARAFLPRAAAVEADADRLNGTKGGRRPTPLYKRCRTGYRDGMLRSATKRTTTTKTLDGVVEARAH